MQNKAAFATIAVFVTALFAATLTMAVHTASATNVCSPRNPNVCAANNPANPGGPTSSSNNGGSAHANALTTVSFKPHLIASSSQPACSDKPLASKNGQKTCAG
jgi:hypothetical protein